MQENKQITKEMWNAVMEKTRISYMKLTLTDSPPSIFESKVGGLGYVPHDEQIPTDSKGFQLRLLAQIDCSQITLPDFPHMGLLQFWIRNDNLYGVDFDHNTHQDGFRICYYKELDRTVTEAEVTEKVGNNLPFGEDFFPVSGCWGLEFLEETETISPSDRHFEGYMKDAMMKFYQKKVEEIPDAVYNDANNGLRHKIGGYPCFEKEDPWEEYYASFHVLKWKQSECDPREQDDLHDVLLFQLDSDFRIEDRMYWVKWKDAGIANFFINRGKLKHCDFSDVIYNWNYYKM